ncbi:hypothetical protein A4X09_0g7740, partial [Tilletia walkeri]
SMIDIPSTTVTRQRQESNAQPSSPPSSTANTHSHSRKSSLVHIASTSTSSASVHHASSSSTTTTTVDHNNRASFRLSRSRRHNDGPPQSRTNSRSLSNVPHPVNRSSTTHIHFRRREATHSASPQSKYRDSSAERGSHQHQPSTLHIITSTAPEPIHNPKTGPPSRTPSNSTPTTFALPRPSQASLSRISTAGRPPRSRTPWRNGPDPRQGRTEQAPSNKSNIKMNTFELLLEDVFNKNKVDIESIQLEDCFSVPRAPTAISPQAKPTTAPSVSSARMPSRAPQRGQRLRMDTLKPQAPHSRSTKITLTSIIILPGLSLQLSNPSSSRPDLPIDSGSDSNCSPSSINPFPRPAQTKDLPYSDIASTSSRNRR